MFQRTLLVILLAGPVSAAQPECLIGFAALSDNEPGSEQLVSNAYGELLDRVGAAKFTPEILDKLIAGKDPFTLPVHGDVDLQVLQKNLKELERMLTAKKWNTPEMRALLLADLGKRRAGVRRAGVIQQEAVEKL